MNDKRFEDGILGRTIRVWPILLGTIGIFYALVTNYNQITSHSQMINSANENIASLNRRVSEIDTQQAVKNSQFSEILFRLNKMEDKIDRISTSKR